jgi:hypothetical protein
LSTLKFSEHSNSDPAPPSKKAPGPFRRVPPNPVKERLAASGTSKRAGETCSWPLDRVAKPERVLSSNTNGAGNGSATVPPREIRSCR